MKPANPDKVFILLGKIFFILCMMGVGYWILELWADERGTERQITHLVTPVEHRYPRPYVVFSGKPDTYPFNALGYVGELPAEEKGEEFRIFVTGGSTVHYGSPTIPVALEERFHKEGYKKVKVFNFGITSSVSGQELARLVFDISRFAPDLVIEYNGGNDIIHGYNWDPRPGYPFNYLLYEANPLLYLNGGEVPHSLLLFLSSSRVFRRIFAPLIEEKILNLRGTVEAQRKKYGGEEGRYNQALLEYVRHLKLSSRIARSLDAGFLAVFQPLQFFDGFRQEDVKHFTEEASAKDNAIYARRFILDRLGEMAGPEKLTFLDFSLIFKDVEGSAFKDAIHVHDKFNVVLADNIYRKIMGGAAGKEIASRIKAAR